VLRYVENHFDKTLTLEEVAALANFSVFHFTRSSGRPPA
jgi:AraC-like DNA-binding protein